MSIWCWSKELVPSFFHFLALPQPPSPSMHLRECTGEGCFFAESRYKAFGRDSPLFMLSATASTGCIYCGSCQCQAGGLHSVVEVVVLGRVKELLLKQMPSARGLCLNQLSALSGGCAT